ncbi:hypothetical protein JMJ77_0007425 [Colletotrichum scovillei]|uniref:Uncharacterized protein n=1 Tax=Colletotrichum scovillei TaxID=1209932 RepID=A0A9P7UL66_9PEZI|nr:hypothetical protein JMJ77_0007425 [Colletotrichum scovillei]KAG7074399.1 hypothetical protein JMJ76_0010879 [Colletotrichum scovillei]KAG7081203.1 hypothetical protein JMJ78_0003329 [Colletotrichum scovillei]
MGFGRWAPSTAYEVRGCLELNNGSQQHMQPRERDTSNGRRTAVAALADCLESLAIVAGTLRGAANSTEKEGEKKEGKRAPTCKSRVEGVTIQPGGKSDRWTDILTACHAMQHLHWTAV